MWAFSDGLGNGGNVGETAEIRRGLGLGVVATPVTVRGAGTGDFEVSTLGGGGADFRREIDPVSLPVIKPGVFGGFGGGGAGAGRFLGDGDGFTFNDCVGDLSTGGGGLPGRTFSPDFP